MLASLDAIAWPAIWITVMATSPFSKGVLGWAVISVAGFAAVYRVCRAIGRNERYWFTSSRWGVPVAILIATGSIIKLLA